MATTTDKDKVAVKSSNLGSGDATAISDTFGGSPVTSDIPADSDPNQKDITGNFENGKLTVNFPQNQPKSEKAKLSESVLAELDAVNRSFATRALDAGIGLVRVEGIDFRYVGLAPARDKDAKTPSGYPVTVDNSRFTPLADVAFDVSIRVKDPKSGEYYYPAEATTWAEVQYNGSQLVGTGGDKSAAAARQKAREAVA